jgi:hypothetical protein
VPSLRLKPPLNLVHHVVHQPATPRFWAAEFQGPAADAFLSPYRQPLFQVQQAARAGGACGGGVGFGGQGLGEGGEQGGPLAGQAFVAVFFQDLVDEVAKAAPQAGGEALDLGLREQFGGGDAALQLFGDKGEAAQAGAFLLGGGGVQRGDGGVDGGEEVLGDRSGEGEAAFPGGEVFADFVFGDHLRHGVGDRGGGAQEGGDGAVAAGVALVQEAQGGEAAQAGDQAVALGRGGLRERPDLDGLAQAVAGVGGGEVFERYGVEMAAVAQQGIFADFAEGEVDHGALR